MIATFIRSFRRWNENRRAVNALAQLSDHQLNDIGLSRSGLVDAVYFGTRS